MLRSIIAVTIGVLVGVTIVIFGAFFVMQSALAKIALHPDGLKSLPVANLLAVVGVWCAGSFFGATAASLAGRRWAPAPWVVAATMAIFAISNFTSDPAPFWMMILTLVGIASGGWGAIKSTSAHYGAPPSGKKPVI